MPDPTQSSPASDPNCAGLKHDASVLQESGSNCNSSPPASITDADVDAIEDEIGMCSGAWDREDPKTIIAAVLKRFGCGCQPPHTPTAEVTTKGVRLTSPPASERVTLATVRVAVDEAGDDCYHIECRFADGSKYAPIVVDGDHEQLAHAIAVYLTQSALQDVETKEGGSDGHL